jgi:hypothetical protein
MDRDAPDAVSSDDLPDRVDKANENIDEALERATSTFLKAGHASSGQTPTKSLVFIDSLSQKELKTRRIVRAHAARAHAAKVPKVKGAVRVVDIYDDSTGSNEDVPNAEDQPSLYMEVLQSIPVNALDSGGIDPFKTLPVKHHTREVYKTFDFCKFYRLGVSNCC